MKLVCGVGTGLAYGLLFLSKEYRSKVAGDGSILPNMSEVLLIFTLVMPVCVIAV